MQAEELLESRSRELYESNHNLLEAIKKLKQQKVHLLQQEKLASIGQLSAGIAHEINNPTGFVKSNLNSLNRYIDNFQCFFGELLGDFANNTGQRETLTKLLEKHDLIYTLEDIGDLVSESLEGIDRVAEIVQSLKDFAHPDLNDPCHYDLNQTIKNTLKLLHNSLKYNVEVQCDFASLPKLRGHPGKIGQVFLNLIVNANQAIEKQGRIKISTRQHESLVIACVEDNGCGIPEAVLDKIFDPFFTTKKIGEGTGLGLSIVSSIVQQEGGYIEVHSETGTGTRIQVSLPLTSRGGGSTPAKPA